MAGFGVALIQRDRRMTFAVAWGVATVLMLFGLSPLFVHHLVALDAPLIAMALFAVPMWERAHTTTGASWYAIGM